MLNLIQLTIIILTIVNSKDLYKILGVTKDSNEKQIKKSFKKEIRRWHPDKNQDNKDYAEKKTIEVNDA